MLVARYQQQPKEDKLREINYAPWLRTGETLVSAVSSFERISGEAVEEIPFEVGGIVIDGAVLKYYLRGGADLSEYKVTFNIQTSSQKREDEVFVRIRDV